MLNIMRQLADCQTASMQRYAYMIDREEKMREDREDRRQGLEEKTLSQLAEHSLLTDRSEGHEMQWLLNL